MATADEVLAWCAQSGITVDPWQEDLVRTQFSGLQVGGRRNGRTTVKRWIAEYEAYARSQGSS